jgi:hypothetical protein
MLAMDVMPAWEELGRLEHGLRVLEQGAPDQPSPAALAQVRAWEAAVTRVADMLRSLDTILERLLPLLGTESELAEDKRAPYEELLRAARARRQEVFDVMRRLNPDQAWFWTEEWQAGEREADADEAAGRTTYHASTEDFLAALDAHLDDEIESDAVARHADA